MSETKNIYQKVAEIRKTIGGAIKKNKKGYGYTYVSEDEILAQVTGKMDKLGVSLIPVIREGSTNVVPLHYEKTKVMKDGNVINEKVNEVLVSADMNWVWVNDENPDDRITVPWSMVGQQSDASQAFGGALTYSSRYFLLKYFNIATVDDDPDNWRTRQKEAENREAKEIATKIIQNVDTIVHQYLDKEGSDREKVCEVVRKYAKDAKNRPTNDYTKITDPEVAAKLLEEVNDNFGEKAGK